MDRPAAPSALTDFEKLGVFYLGRTVTDGVGRDVPSAPFLYESKRLTTHAVVIGMTGSGKTGLSTALLEEAAIDGVPALVVDPKGDLGNLLLTFPDLRAEDFAPWVPAGTEPAGEARRWADGLAAWGEDGARIARLRAAAELAVYTPGSRAGRPISILGSLAAPRDGLRDAEALNERAAQVATSLLGLVGVQAEPGRSREHVLLATLLRRAWDAGEDLDLARLVVRIQDPGASRLGVLDLESFFPKKERFELAVAFNAILAAPGFEAWLDGVPLDIDALLWTPEGKPRIAVLSIAHLGDAERMFFVSLLLGQLVSWMRTQPGTPSLRALFFMDEMVGYFPPVAVPPSKPPLLLLLKQARAFGLGLVLATQNPVDLDYKGLSNAGTWFVGRLQTERDKARVLEALAGASGGRAFDRQGADRTLTGLKKRHFYVHDVAEDHPVVIESRWTLSYLRGPLTRDELRTLAGVATPAAEPPGGPPASRGPGEAVEAGAPPLAPTPGEPTSERPLIPPGVPEVFFPTSSPSPTYVPCVVGAARVHFEDGRTGLDFAREVMFVTPVVDGPVPLRWEDARWAAGLSVRELAGAPVQNARFLPPPSPALVAKNYAAWSKKLVAWLAATQGVARLRCPEVELIAQVGEDERAFRLRLAQLARERRDESIAKVRRKYAPKVGALEERIRAAEHAVAREEAQASAQRLETGLSIGGGLLASFLGGGSRRVMASARGAIKSASRAGEEAADVAREREKLAALVHKHGELKAEIANALATCSRETDPATMALESVVSKPKRTGISVHLVALAWRPT